MKQRDAAKRLAELARQKAKLLEEQERIRRENERINKLMSQWPRLAWAYEQFMRKNERTWAFIEIKYVRSELNRRFARL